MEVLNITNYKGGLFFVGTSNFEEIWEKVCTDYFDNSILFTVDDNDIMHENTNGKNLKTLFDSQNLFFYSFTSFAGVQSSFPFDGLKPDIIKIENKEFSIFDAKYYNFSKDSYPERGDILKQFLYQIAYFPIYC